MSGAAGVMSLFSKCILRSSALGVLYMDVQGSDLLISLSASLDWETLSVCAANDETPSLAVAVSRRVELKQ